MNSQIVAYKIRKRYFQLTGEKRYSSYADAMEDCVSEGYENNTIIQLAVNKARKIRALSSQNNFNHLDNSNLLSIVAIINLLSSERRTLNIIDFGGGDGAPYLFVKACVSKDVSLNWFVVETPALAEAMKEFETPELHFVSDLGKLIDSSHNIDLIHTSGTLQYTDDPYHYLHLICGSKAKYKIFNRQSLNDSEEDIITVQRSLLSWHGSKGVDVNFIDREIRYPHTNMSIRRFERIIFEKHKLLFSYQDNSGLTGSHKDYMIGKSYCIKKL